MAETYPILICYYSLRQNQHQIDLIGYNSWVEMEDCDVGISNLSIHIGKK
jgi:hypothetical protein